MASGGSVDRLVIVTAAGSHAGLLTDRLVRDGFHVTRVSRESVIDELPVSLFVGLNHGRLATLLQHVRESCQTRLRYLPAQFDAPTVPAVSMIEAQVGGAAVHVLAVERFEQL